MLSFCDKEKYSLKISTLKTPLKNMFPKSFPAISHNSFSIQIKGQYILHNNFSIQKYAYTISHNPFSDQKEGYTISHNPKIDLRDRSFRPSG